MRIIILALLTLAVVPACSDKPGKDLPDGGGQTDIGRADGGTGDASTAPDLGDNGGTPGTPWVHVSPWLRSPETSLHDAMAYHEESGQTVLVTDGTTWLWNGTRWTSLEGPEGPREGHALAYDAARAQVVLFGGRNGTDVEYDDTWLFDGTSWTQAEPATVPPSRYFHGMSYDAARERVVMHGGGGYDGDPIRGDTWEWNGTDWVEATPENTPGDRSAHAMSYDAARERIVLYGGTVGGGFRGDVWEWDGNDWTDVTPEAEGPPDRIFSQLVYDPEREASLLIAGERANNFFGDAWAWDGQGWTELPNAGLLDRYGHAAAYDSGAKQVLLFGGIGPEGEGLNGRFTKTLALGADGPWQDVSPNTATPDARGGLASAWDPVREEVVVFGGASDRGGLVGATWVWDGANWRDATPETGPEARRNGRMIADEARGNIVLFGGRSGNRRFGDTWLWDGADWVEVTPEDAPGERTRHAMGYDADRERVVLFGGRSDTPTTLGETWEWDGDTWALIADGADEFGSRFFPSFNLVPAPQGGLLMLGRRTDGMNFTEELWHWNGTAWTLRAELGGERGNRQFQAGAWDGVRGTLVVFGGNESTEVFDETWEVFDGAWRQLTPAIHPPPSTEASMVWQPNRRKILFYGGDQTWEWNGAVALPLID